MLRIICSLIVTTLLTSCFVPCFSQESTGSGFSEKSEVSESASDAAKVPAKEPSSSAIEFVKTPADQSNASTIEAVKTPAKEPNASASEAVKIPSIETGASANESVKTPANEVTTSSGDSAKSSETESLVVAPTISLPTTLPSIPSTPQETTEKPSKSAVAPVEPEEDEAPLSSIDTKDIVRFTLDYPRKYPFPLVGIRVPSDYEVNFAGDLVPLKGFKKTSKAAIEEMVNEQVVKSTYLACDFYNHLKHKLPPHSIILVPTKLKYEKGRIVCEQIFNPIPSLIEVDFFAEINPKRVQNPNGNLSSDDTFGSHLRLFLTVNGIRDGKRQVLAGQAVLDPANNEYSESIETLYNNIYNGGKLKSVSTVDGLPVSSKALFEQGSFTQLHTEFSCPHKTILLQSEANPGRVESAAARAWNYYGNVIIGALNTMDLTDCRQFLLTESVKDIAPDVAEILKGKVSQSEVAIAKKKVSYFNHFLAHERESVFSLLTNELVNKTWKEKFGSSVREQFKSELLFAKQCAASKRRQVGASVLGLASLGGAVATALTVPSIPVSGLLVGISAAAVKMVVNEAALQKQLRESITELSSKMSNTEVGFLLALDDDTIEVEATKIENLPKKMKQIYNQKFTDAPSTP